MLSYFKYKQHEVQNFSFGKCAAGTLQLQAQEKKQPAHIGFIYPLSSNGRQAPLYTNSFSLHMLAGVSRCETGVAMAGISLVIKDSARGMQLSGISNHIGCATSGVQIAGVMNMITDSRGIAIACVMNHSVKAKMQVTGVVNNARQVNGMQIAGVVNHSVNNKGQIAGVVNIAKEVKGIQVAGVINKAKRVKGLQLAGLINIADSSDYPIALINIVKNGNRHISVSVDESGNALASFRSGGRVLYGIIGLGYNVRASTRLMATEGGLGMHLIQKGPWGLQAEIANVWMYDFDGADYSRSMLRVLPSYAIAGKWRVWAGPSFGYNHTNRKETADLVHPIWEKRKADGTYRQLSFGVTGGIQLTL